MIIRIKKRDNPYIVLDVTSLRDKRLSASAKGVHAYLMTLPDDWKIRLTEISNHFADGYTSIRSAFGELEKYNYARIERDNKKGTSNWRVTIWESPQSDDPVTESVLLTEATVPRKKLKRTPAEQTFTEVMAVLPEKWKTEIQPWQDWFEYRKSLGRPFTASAAKILVTKCGQHSFEIITNALSEAILKGWVGVFPRVDCPSASKGSPTPPSSLSKRQSIIMGVINTSELAQKYPARNIAECLSVIEQLYDDLPGELSNPDSAKACYGGLAGFAEKILTGLIPNHIQRGHPKLTRWLAQEQDRIGQPLAPRRAIS